MELFLGYNTTMIDAALIKQFPDLTTIPESRFPSHIFIIPDGNGRWAKQHGKFVTEGHKKGFDAAYKILTMLGSIKEIHTVTLWGFSADNWKRSEREIHGLMLLFQQIIKRTLKDLQKRNGRFIHLGRKDRLPQTLVKVIADAEAATATNTGQIVCLAIDFGGEDQEQRMLAKAITKRLVLPIDEDTVWQLRDTGGLIRSADLIIRTSGEIRISDIGWINGAQTELYFTPKYFPDVTVEDIITALVDFSKRERRFGGRKEV